ncbi:hypothetical protein EC973_009347 [Apophysomyces ossiformis]|uniref:C2H2-type domain-containing protein n=1 Tax=Apophysomyces ossiformis TaxID=679940 RepID=A0A8H7BYF9_9FUNG|nr:hypothetical protein EC973_009347 [Apophysomyces ossiformis]
MNEIEATMPMDESPVMDTPYLDAGMDTPLSTSAMFTPYFSPYSALASPCIEPGLTYNNATSSISNGDVDVSNYLGGENEEYHTPMLGCATPAWNTTTTTGTIDPVATFNGDPSQLLIDKTKTAPLQLQSTASSDSLFPPLGSQDIEEVPIKHEFDSQHTENHNPVFDFSGFDFNDASLSEDAGHQAQDQQSGDESATQTQPSDEDEKENEKEKDDDDYSSASACLHSDEDVKVTSKKRSASCQVDSGRRKRRSSPEERRYQCHVCSRMFSRRYNLSTHIRTHDKNRQKEFGCEHCPKAFDRKHDLARHVATVHHGERSFPCHRCSSIFSRKDALTRHTLQKHATTFDGE